MEERQTQLNEDMDILEDYLEVRPFYVCNSFFDTDEEQTMDMLEVENLYAVG